MQNEIKTIIILIFVILFIPLITYSHSARTDSAGGHMIVLNDNLQKKTDILCYIGITIVVTTLLYICYLLKKIDELKVENKSK